MYNINSTLTTAATLADLKAYTSWIATRLATVGWVQTVDTGQLTIANIPAISAVAGYSYGYQIWRMNDTLQSTAPVYLKLEFYTPSSSYFGLAITLGTLSDGAGNLAGQVGPRILLGNNSSSATAYESRMSGDINWCCFSLWNGASNLMFSIERSKDALGNDISDGVMIFYKSALGNGQYYLPFSGKVYTAITGLQFFSPTGVTALAVGNDVTLLPLIPYTQEAIKSPGIGWVISLSPDIADGQTFPMAYDNGVTHTYWATGQLAATGAKIAMRWE
jgi:hypothetical protein